MRETKCPTCGHADCVVQGDALCESRKHVNSLVAAVKLLVKSSPDVDSVKMALVVVEHATPSSSRCPHCGQPGVVRNGAVNVHFASTFHDKPCFASWKTVVGGVLWDKGKPLL